MLTAHNDYRANLSAGSIPSVRGRSQHGCLSTYRLLIGERYRNKKTAAPIPPPGGHVWNDIFWKRVFKRVYVLLEGRESVLKSVFNKSSPSEDGHYV